MLSHDECMHENEIRCSLYLAVRGREKVLTVIPNCKYTEALGAVRTEASTESDIKQLPYKQARWCLVRFSERRRAGSLQQEALRQLPALAPKLAPQTALRAAFKKVF